MKRFFFLLACAVLLVGIQFLVNCSTPLDSISGASPFPSDTVTIVDTVIQIDTVIITEPDSSGLFFVCSRLSAGQQEIVWLFRNEEGMFHLEYAASAEFDQPTQLVIVDIDGEQFEWRPSSNPEFILDHNLEENATMRITLDQPPSFGHAIDICLTLTAQ